MHPALLAALLLATPTSAAAQVSVEAAPLRVELQAQPGASTTQAVTLSNRGAQPLRVKVSVADWYLSREGAPQFQEPQDGRAYSASGWIRSAPPEFILDAGRQGTVRFTLTVPQGVDAAGYRTGLVFDFSPLDPSTATAARQVLFKSRIATLIYVHVGQPATAVELTDLQVRKAAEEMQVVASLKNTSRRSIRTKGTLVVYDGAGKTVRQVPVPDVPVLPESERDVAITTLDATGPLPPGEYRVEVKIDVGLPAVIVGETTLKVAG